jgi:hypothetical protein
MKTLAQFQRTLGDADISAAVRASSDFVDGIDACGSERFR